MTCLNDLGKLPAGSHIIIDTNILVYWALDDPIYGSICEKFLVRADNKDIYAYIPYIVFNEFFHRLMLAETILLGLADNWNIALVVLKKNPEIISQFHLVWTAYLELIRLNISIFEDYPGLNINSIQMAREYGLLMSDAAVVAYAHKYHITNIATNDNDFQRIPWLIGWTPSKNI